jgi:DNA (cytosine-5)-methyltransferase 1
MRKTAGISTNVLAKMGKNETVSMNTLGKVSNALNCGLDDIVEITSEVDNYV